ncbi:MAG: hypothetical protein EXR07_14200 [Acetobacteraceae bacterium]|nr:hypothetical protein [Acetobacteraceae bacterium]
MSDTSKNNVLDYPRGQFARVHSKLDGIAADVSNLKGRGSGLEADAGHTHIALAELNTPVKRVDMRLERIERRLDLVDQPMT